MSEKKVVFGRLTVDLDQCKISKGMFNYNFERGDLRSILRAADMAGANIDEIEMLVAEYG